MLCNSCGSYRHLAKDCPHKYESQFHHENSENRALVEDQNGDGYQNMGQIQEFRELQLDDSHEEDVRETHFSGIHLFDVLYNGVNSSVIHLDETKGHILQDTGCVKSVCGSTWFKDLMSTLSKKTVAQIKSYPSRNLFRVWR